jgi:membrane protein implicated in regulation of membrane protease activity
MESLLSGVEAWQVWAIAGVVLCILEIFTPGFFLMALGAGCFIAALGSLMVGLNGQIVFFLVGSVIFFFASRKLFLPMKSEHEDKFGMERLLGKTGYAIGEVTSDSGYIRVGGEKWPARTEENIILPDSTTVEVYAFRGNKLKVRAKG